MKDLTILTAGHVSPHEIEASLSFERAIFTVSVYTPPEEFTPPFMCLKNCFNLFDFKMMERFTKLDESDIIDAIKSEVIKTARVA